MSERIDDGGPVFPCVVETVTKMTYTIDDPQAAAFGETREREVPVKYNSSGMSLRDWFAGQALIGLSAGWAMLRHTDDAAAMHGGPTIPDEAEDAYRYADAMLAARKLLNGGVA